MSRREFLEKLREALSNELGASVVQENIDYYNNYISKEVGKGYTEEGVVEELGDPWVIARTIIDGQGTTGSTYTSYETDAYENQNGYQNDTDSAREFHIFGIDTWWKKLLAIVVIVLVIISVIALVTGIIGLIAPILIPVLIIVFIIRILGNR